VMTGEGCCLDGGVTYDYDGERTGEFGNGESRWSELGDSKVIL
jgi:hypothetical protein